MQPDAGGTVEIEAGRVVARMLPQEGRLVSDTRDYAARSSGLVLSAETGVGLMLSGLFLSGLLVSFFLLAEIRIPGLASARRARRNISMKKTAAQQTIISASNSVIPALRARQGPRSRNEPTY